MDARNIRTHKTMKLRFLTASFVTLFVCLLFVRGYVRFESTGDNFFHIVLNNVEIGSTGDALTAERLLIEARRTVASERGEMTFLDAELRVEGEEVLFGEIDSEEHLLTRMEDVLRGAVREALIPSYTVKIGEYMVSLASEEEVVALLQAAVDRYDTSGQFHIELVQDSGRDFTVQTVYVSADEKQDFALEEAQVYTEGGASYAVHSLGLGGESADEALLDFEDYTLGIMEMSFVDRVEISEGFLPTSQLTPLPDAIHEVTKEEEKPSIYEVVSGDTLYGISMTLDIPLDDLIAMNDSLENESSLIRVGDELVYMIPEPEFAVEYVERSYVEEVYDAPTIYIDNDEWYTTESVTLTQPSAGFRRIIVDETYINSQLAGREILKEELVMEAVAKVVERGTKIPPTYIKPIAGGRVTSGFGRRSSPGGIGSTNHKGVDWYVPVGTSVWASSGGVVRSAGWGSGYGYVIYIDHPDGRQTRYAHLSKILVSAGQTVSQGEVIARSGATGNVTGPHLHFEILINGTQVNPLNYVPQ